MKTLYIDCCMGAAGDMLTAALMELCPDREAFLKKINAALGGNAVLSASADQKCGVKGTQVTVTIGGDTEGEEHKHRHEHTDVHRLQTLIKGMPLSEKVRADAVAVFDSIAQAEAEVHGHPMENIHLHEVGSLDAVADVVAVCLLMEMLSPDDVLASPVNVGGGTVKCAHGVLPVPAPAAERLLRGIPTYSGLCKTELCTPTGAALLRHFVRDFVDMPRMCVLSCGYGMGKKDLPQLNAVRVFLGECQTASGDLFELSCNLDDMTGEDLGFALEELLRHGALDAWTTPIGMKKSRPGVLLSCLCREEQRNEMLLCFFRHTTTLGVRERRCTRWELSRSIRTQSSPLGEIHVKHAEGTSVVREKPEFDDLARIARENDLSLQQVRQRLKLR